MEPPKTSGSMGFPCSKARDNTNSEGKLQYHI